MCRSSEVISTGLGVSGVVRVRCSSAQPQTCQVISSLIKKNRFILNGWTLSLCLQLLCKHFGAVLVCKCHTSRLQVNSHHEENICTLEWKYTTEIHSPTPSLTHNQLKQCKKCLRTGQTFGLSDVFHTNMIQFSLFSATLPPSPSPVRSHSRKCGRSFIFLQLTGSDFSSQFPHAAQTKHIVYCLFRIICTRAELWRRRHGKS